MWELYVKRIQEQEFKTRKRTLSQYKVLIDGQETKIKGYMCEPCGPSSNDTKGNRIGTGKYGLSTQFGKYVSIDFNETPIAQSGKMPSIRLLDTGNRSDILIHTAHTKIDDGVSDLWLSSIGCFNPTMKIQANQEMDFNDTWDKTIELIDSLKAFEPSVFEGEKINQIIPNAFVIVEDNL